MWRTLLISEVSIDSFVHVFNRYKPDKKYIEINFENMSLTFKV